MIMIIFLSILCAVIGFLFFIVCSYCVKLENEIKTLRNSGLNEDYINEAVSEEDYRIEREEYAKAKRKYYADKANKHYEERRLSDNMTPEQKREFFINKCKQERM